MKSTRRWCLDWENENPEQPTERYGVSPPVSGSVRFFMKSEMNKEERIVKAYLRSLGFKDIIFEPDGNIPPDFLIDSRIGVEVRRLNQHFFTKGEVRGLEETRIPLFKLVESSLGEFDSQYNGLSYWVSIRFHRPVGKGNRQCTNRFS